MTDTTGHKGPIETDSATATSDHPTASHDANSNVTAHLASTTSRPNDSLHNKSKSAKSRPICKYFGTRAGCRAGDNCKFQHRVDDTVDATVSGSRNNVLPSGCTTKTPSHTVARRAPVAKPVSQAETDNPREFQITQVVRRYRPFRADLDDNTTLKFRLEPTDPDFPFQLDGGLHCLISVPVGYPQNGRPKLAVQNAEMARGFQINVEQGFDEIVDRHPGKSLLALLNELDRNLERLLSSRKATTLKLVANRARPEVSFPSSIAAPASSATATSAQVYSRYTDVQLREARVRRDAEIRQLEARLGRSEVFSKIDGTAWNVPVQVPAHSNLPPALQAVRDAALIVPEVYPLEPCTIVLKNVHGQDAEAVEVAFERMASSKPELSLMAHLNYLATNMHKLLESFGPPKRSRKPIEETEDDIILPSTKTSANEDVVDPARPHIRYIARPPEWSMVHDKNDSDQTASSSDESTDEREDDLDDVESSTGGVTLPSSVEKGMQLSFPGMELQGVELHTVSRLSISVKCDRCKEMADFKDLSPDIQHSHACAKCNVNLTATFHPQLMHPTSAKAGHIEVENCTIVDLLPSLFQPTCAQCSTPFPSPPGIVAVGGDTKMIPCRSCHSKMSFTIPETKFLRTSTATSGTLPLKSRRPKEKLGTVAGTPLPHNGKCQHYSKSYRWFRFSCCNRVFPCDKCHDLPVINPAQKDNPHPNEHADRMICGWCSREQRYHPETCRMCGRSVVKKSVTTGFWEGGKGTRDKVLMRKKEGRKFKTSGREKKDMAEVKKRKENKGLGGQWWPSEVTVTARPRN